MDMSTIPRSFWHAVSFSLIALTIGTLFISFSFGRIDVRYKGFLISSNNLDAQKKVINELSKTLEKSEKEIQNLQETLTKKINEIESLKATFQAAKNNDKGWHIFQNNLLAEFTKVLDDKQFEEKVAESKKKQEELKVEQVELQSDYEARRKLFENIPNYNNYPANSLPIFIQQK